MKRFFNFVLIFIFLGSFVVSCNVVANAETAEVNSAIVRNVCPIGINIGLKLYTNGVLVIGMSEIKDIDGNTFKPYENTGIKEGDIIKSINGNEVQNTEQLVDILNQSNGNEISLKYQRNNDDIYTTIKPIKSTDEKYMIGLWVRDAAAGLGTLSYYEKNTSKFAALGHGIEDVDTGKLLNISNGEIVTSKIISIVKGEKGKPGEIRGIIDGGNKVGEIEKNTNLGVYGFVTNKDFINSVSMEEMPVATRNQIKIGKAEIYCQLSDEGVRKFNVEIKKIYRNSNDNKSMLIKVVDRDLLDLTGGIIPGMSGTPIVQNGRFVGAITNVLLKDPTQGYAIFADIMINQ